MIKKVNYKKLLIALTSLSVLLTPSVSAESLNWTWKGFSMIFYVKLYNKAGELIADVFAKQKENMYGTGGLYDNVRDDYINPNVDARFINYYIYGELSI